MAQKDFSEIAPDKPYRRLPANTEVRINGPDGQLLHTALEVIEAQDAGYEIICVAQTERKRQIDAVKRHLRRTSGVKKEKPILLSSAERRAAVNTSLNNLPDDYSDCRKTLSELSHAFRLQVAAALGPRLNETLKAKSYETYADKQAVASWVNNELRQLGLAIKCPKTGRPAILVADVQGGEDSPSRFRYQVRGSDGTVTRTFSSRTLPQLELMEDEVRQEPITKRFER